MSKRPNAGSLAGPLAVVVLWLLVLAVNTNGFRAITEEGARRLNVAAHMPAIPRFDLEDMNGRALTMGGDGQQKITVVEFIYTTCPTICQFAGTDFARLRDKIRHEDHHRDVRLLSVSFDPERDDLEQMQAYADHHEADGTLWTIARIAAPDLERLKGSFGLRIIPDKPFGFQHNAAIHIIDRFGRLRSIVDFDDVDAAHNTIADLI